MQVYHLSVLLTFVIFSSVVVGQVCVPLNATFTTSNICSTTYNISSIYNNATAGDNLSSFFSTSSRIDARCAKAFATYYCSNSYPNCNSSYYPVCENTCSAVLAACSASDQATISASLPFPTAVECDELNTTRNCSSSDVNILDFYSDCTEVSLPTLQEPEGVNSVICHFVNQTRTVLNDSYAEGKRVWNALKGVAQAYGSELNETDFKACFLAFGNFYCAQAFPNCTEALNPAVNVPVCRDACSAVLSACDAVKEYFGNPRNLGLPALSYCGSLPATNCYTPVANDTNLEYFFSSIIIEPTEAPTRAPTPNRYPPGGAGKGAGVGVGVLIGLMLIIAGLMLIMKKQDSR